GYGRLTESQPHPRMRTRAAVGDASRGWLLSYSQHLSGAAVTLETVRSVAASEDRPVHDDLAGMLRDMMRIRIAEETLADLYKEQEMRTPTHFSIGQEAVAVGVCSALDREDAVYSGHRCHAHYLAKGGPLGPMVAELYGKQTGTAHGRGGSVHLS